MKKPRNILWVTGALLFALTALSAPAAETYRIPLASESRTYEYRGLVTEGEHKGQKESMTLSFSRAGTNIVCKSQITGKDKLEQGETVFTEAGRLISAKRDLRVGAERDKGKIWVVQNYAVIKRDLNGKVTTKRKALSQNLPILADTAVLAFMRSLPFEVGKSTTVEIIGYRQNVIEANLTTLAEERVKTPAGEYDCYKVELLVQVLFFKKRIEYWLSKEAPHFMVRHRGLRGAGSPEYDTVLERVVPPKNTSPSPPEKKVD